MSPKRDPESGTYGSVRDRYRDWKEQNPQPASRSALRMPTVSDAAERLVGMVVGFGTGVLLLILAIVAYRAAGSWSGVERDGAAVAYTLTAFFLAVAGIGAVAGTWNHAFRVLRSEPEHH